MSDTWLLHELQWWPRSTATAELWTMHWWLRRLTTINKIHNRKRG